MPMKSPGLTDEKKFLEQSKSLSISPEESKAIFFYHDRARKAYEQRERAWEYFDGLTYYDDYMLNRQAANTYLRPKKNDGEVRVNTGVAEKKIEVIYNELLGLNLKGNVRAYDENDEILDGLGETFTDVVHRSNEMEKDEDIMAEAYLEGLTQRAVFLIEEWIEENVRDRLLSRVGFRPVRKARKRLISGLKVFLGNIRLPWYRINEQPYIVICENIHWKEAERKWKNNKNWKHVVKGGGGDSIFGLRYGTVSDDEVQVLTYMSYDDDEKMVLCQGVPMDEIGTKLQWEYEGYNLRMFGLKTMGREFAYMRPLTASSKVLQSLNNESIRLVIRKWRQALEPPLGVKAGKVFSRDIFEPSASTQGLTKDDFVRLIDHEGPTQGDFSMMDLIDKKTEEFVGASNLQQGFKERGDMTATEIQALQRQFIKQLGLSVLMVMNMHREMTYLRLYNLLENATKPVGKKMDRFTAQIVNAYQQFTIDGADIGEGRIGKKEVVFSDRTLEQNEIEQMREMEERQHKLGKEFRMFWINVQKLREIPIHWYVTVSQSLKESDELDKVLFKDSLAQGVAVSQVSGRPLAGDSIIEDFERTWKKRNWFQKQAPQQLLPVPGLENLEQGGENIIDRMKPRVEQRPSINTVRSIV